MLTAIAVIKYNGASKTSDPRWVQSDSHRSIKKLTEFTLMIKQVSSGNKSFGILKDNLVSVVEAVKCSRGPIWPKHMWAVKSGYGWHVYLFIRRLKCSKGQQSQESLLTGHRRGEKNPVFRWLMHRHISSCLGTRDDRAAGEMRGF